MGKSISIEKGLGFFRTIGVWDPSIATTETRKISGKVEVFIFFVYFS